MHLIFDIHLFDRSSNLETIWKGGNPRKGTLGKYGHQVLEAKRSKPPRPERMESDCLY